MQHVLKSKRSYPRRTANAVPNSIGRDPFDLPNNRVSPCLIPDDRKRRVALVRKHSQRIGCKEQSRLRGGAAPVRAKSTASLARC